MHVHKKPLYSLLKSLLLNNLECTVESFYSWGLMFQDNQKVPGLLRCNFVGNCFVALQGRTFLTLIYICWNVNLWTTVTHEIHEHNSPTQNIMISQ